MWGFDCGDANIYFDPYDVCHGDLPPNNGCGNTGCTPLTLEISQGICEEGPSGLESSLLLTFGTAGDCSPSSLFFNFNSGTEQEIELGENFQLENPYTFLAHEGPGTYQFHFETTEGAVSPYFYFSVIDQCAGVSKFCDCAGQQWFMETLDALGNGELNDGLNPTDGKYIDFNCQTWAYDCGDNPAFSEDAFNVCAGELPPENGCIELVTGCMNPVACNFDPSAIIDDSTCVLADDGFDCEGNCLADTDLDGICDAFEVPGCTSPDACNYDEHATDDDASCDFDSCFGCMELSASNYNPDATMDDGSCIFLNILGCAADINEDGFVNTSDLLLLMAEYGMECAN